MVSDTFHSLSVTMLWLPLFLGPIWYAIYYFLCGDKSILPGIMKGGIALGVESGARIFSNEAKPFHVRYLVIVDCISSAILLFILNPSNIISILITAAYVIAIVNIPEWTRNDEVKTTWAIGISIIVFGLIIRIL